MSKAILPILNKVMLGQLSPESAMKLIAVWYGERKSATCALDNLPDKCPIFKIGNSGCAECGHYHKII